MNGVGLTQGEYTLFLVLVWMCGACIGSFLNVVIYRFGTGKGFGGRSHCGTCNRTLSWVDLVPIMSYLCLWGRCRTCHARISVQYPLVEAIAGLLFVGAASVFTGWSLLVSFGIVSIALCIGVYDWLHMRIPMLWNVLLMLSACAFVLFGSLEMVMMHALAGVVLGGVFLAVHLFSRGAVLGFGDVPIGATIGILLGLLDGLTAIWVGCVAGSVYGIANAYLFSGKRPRAISRMQIPFAPFLLLGMISVWFGGVSFFELLAYIQV